MSMKRTFQGVIFFSGHKWGPKKGMRILHCIVVKLSSHLSTCPQYWVYFRRAFSDASNEKISFVAKPLESLTTSSQTGCDIGKSHRAGSYFTLPTQMTFTHLCDCHIQQLHGVSDSLPYTCFVGSALARQVHGSIFEYLSKCKSQPEGGEIIH